MPDLITDLRQKHIEELELQLGLLPTFRTVGGVKLQRYYGSFVRAGIAAGWFGDTGEVEEITTKKGNANKVSKRYLLGGVEVGDMLATEVKEIGESVESAYNDAVTIDPN